MHFSDLQNFITHLETVGDLVRVKEEVDPYLEVADIVNRTCKDPKGNSALLFEDVKGFALPLVANCFGSSLRTAAALGVTNVESLTLKLRADLRAIEEKESGRALAKLIQGQAEEQGTDDDFLAITHVECEKGLSELPVLYSWPKEGGPYITLGQVFTKKPDSKEQNCGMYRLQVVDKETALVRFHPGSGGGEHLEAWHARGEAMPIAVVLGGPPALTLCAGMSLPEGVTETDFVKYLTGHSVAMAKCQNSELFVPSTAEIVIEGLISPGDKMEEGPFGNHTGYYSDVSPVPVVKVLNVYMRESAVYPCTVVGPPPMENVFMAQANERLLLELLRYDCPWVVNVHMPREGIYHRAALVSVAEHDGSAAKINESLNGSRLLRNSRMIVLLDKDCDLHNFRDVYWRFINAEAWEESVLIDGKTMVVDARASRHRNSMFNGLA
jgi:4-hydroxy-3-polyprenylbenzoate decarboxylase